VNCTNSTSMLSVNCGVLHRMGLEGDSQNGETLLYVSYDSEAVIQNHASQNDIHSSPDQSSTTF